MEFTLSAAAATDGCLSEVGAEGERRADGVMKVTGLLEEMCRGFCDEEEEDDDKDQDRLCVVMLLHMSFLGVTP